MDCEIVAKFICFVFLIIVSLVLVIVVGVGSMDVVVALTTDDADSLFQLYRILPLSSC